MKIMKKCCYSQRKQKMYQKLPNLIDLQAEMTTILIKNSFKNILNEAQFTFK